MSHCRVLFDLLFLSDSNMGFREEYYLTISVTVMSVVLTIETIIAAVWIMLQFYCNRKTDIIIRKCRKIGKMVWSENSYH